MSGQTGVWENCFGSGHSDLVTRCAHTTVFNRLTIPDYRTEPGATVHHLRIVCKLLPIKLLVLQSLTGHSLGTWAIKRGQCPGRRYQLNCWTVDWGSRGSVRLPLRWPADDLFVLRAPCPQNWLYSFFRSFFSLPICHLLLTVVPGGCASRICTGGMIAVFFRPMPQLFRL